MIRCRISHSLEPLVSPSTRSNGRWRRRCPRFRTSTLSFLIH
jgi:hypothetical protein